jgi:hypothetical protein
MNAFHKVFCKSCNVVSLSEIQDAFQVQGIFEKVASLISQRLYFLSPKYIMFQFIKIYFLSEV